MWRQPANANNHGEDSEGDSMITMAMELDEERTTIRPTVLE